MTDRVSKEVRSRIMSKIRSKDTKIELLVFRALRKRKVYFQKHYKKAPGTPDIAVPSRKIAVFIEGDFWHGYRYPAWRDKLPNEFWQDKIERNRARDRKNLAKLRRDGWRVMRVWEHHLKKDAVDGTLEKIIEFIETTKAERN